jgi:hypothetical protein
MNINKINLIDVSKVVFQYYLGNQFPGGRVILGRNIPNPFLSNKQIKPSFNILEACDGSWIYHDFDTNDTGSCVTFISSKEGISTSEAIKKINNLKSIENDL